MLRVTNVSGSTLSVDGRIILPGKSTDVPGLTTMIEYLKGQGAVTIDRVAPPAPSKSTVEPAVEKSHPRPTVIVESKPQPKPSKSTSTEES